MTDEEWVEYKIKNAPRLSLKDCLFCKENSNDLQSNLKHMMNAHGFFIPDIEYLTDLEGLISYLGEKVSVGNLCLYCNERGKRFYSLPAVTQHMREKGHCKILYDLTEFEDFYDFSSSWDQSNLDEEGNPKIETPNLNLAPNGLELVLARNGSQKVLGHRSLAVYYNQRISERRIVAHSLNSEFKRLQQIEEQKAKQMDKKDFYRQQRQYMRLGVKANSLQKFFRSENPI